MTNPHHQLQQVFPSPSSTPINDRCDIPPWLKYLPPVALFAPKKATIATLTKCRGNATAIIIIIINNNFVLEDTTKSCVLLLSFPLHSSPIPLPVNKRKWVNGICANVELRSAIIIKMPQWAFNCRRKEYIRVACRLRERTSAGRLLHSVFLRAFFEGLNQSNRKTNQIKSTSSFPC